MGEPPERAEIRGCEPVSRHTHHVLWLFAAAGPPAVPDRKAEDPVSLISRLAPIGFVAVHRPVRGGGGMTDPGSSVLGGGGMTDADSAVLGGGGITGPSGPKSKWDVLQVQLAGELSHSKSGGES